jgi:hypothetical protein
VKLSQRYSAILSRTIRSTSSQLLAHGSANVL